jgi:hypothetical protein
MEFQLSRAMLASIDKQIPIIRKANRILDVYNAAEVIRVKHITDNIAREDIIAELILRADLNAILGFNNPENEPKDILEVINGPNMEMLMPMDLKFPN